MSVPPVRGRIRTSAAARDCSISASVVMVAERIRMETIGGPAFQAPDSTHFHQEGGFSRAAGSTPRVWDMSTPMMGPEFSWRITLVGKFFSTAPSTRTWPSMTTGGRTPGMAIEARMARRIRPAR